MEDNKRTNTGGKDPMEDKLRELTEDTQVPASLEPEQIEKMLLKKKKEKTVKYREICGDRSSGVSLPGGGGDGGDHRTKRRRQQFRGRSRCGNCVRGRKCRRDSGR